MGAKCGMSAATVASIWQSFALKPHRHGRFEWSKVPLCVAIP